MDCISPWWKFLISRQLALCLVVIHCDIFLQCAKCFCSVHQLHKTSELLTRFATTKTICLTASKIGQLIRVQILMSRVIHSISKYIHVQHLYKTTIHKHSCMKVKSFTQSLSSTPWQKLELHRCFLNTKRNQCQNENVRAIWIYNNKPINTRLFTT